MRGSQSDPTHTYAPVCTCLRTLRARYARARRVGLRGRANTTLLAGCQGLARRECCADTTNDLTGLQRALGGWPIRWPRRGLLAGLAGLLGALLGLCVWRGMLGRRGRACDACFHCTNPQHCTAIQYQGYALSVWLCVWPRPGWACPERMA